MEDWPRGEPTTDVTRSTLKGNSAYPAGGTLVNTAYSSGTATVQIRDGGPPFTSTNATMIYGQYLDVADWNQLFFRLEPAP